MRILKYIFETQEISISLPAGSRALHVHEQRGRVTLWILESDGPGMEIRIFRAVGTGEEFNLRLADRYVGTAHVDEFVWHVFDVTPRMVGV